MLIDVFVFVLSSEYILDRKKHDNVTKEEGVAQVCMRGCDTALIQELMCT